MREMGQHASLIASVGQLSTTPPTHGPSVLAESLVGDQVLTGCMRGNSRFTGVYSYGLGWLCSSCCGTEFRPNRLRAAAGAGAVPACGAGELAMLVSWAEQLLVGVGRPCSKYVDL